MVCIYICSWAVKSSLPCFGSNGAENLQLTATGLALFYIAIKERKGYVCGITVVVN